MRALPLTATLAQTLDFSGVLSFKGSRVAEYLSTYRSRTYKEKENMYVSHRGFRNALPTLPATLMSAPMAEMRMGWRNA